MLLNIFATELTNEITKKDRKNVKWTLTKKLWLLS